MTSPTDDLSAIADSLVGALPGCDDAPVALALVRELANGEPISEAALATVTSRDAAEITAALARWPSLQRDEHQRVIAFSGLSLRPTAHTFEVGGQQLYTWCAWDTLFLPAMLDRPARVQSRCPVTGTTIRLTVDPDRVSASEHERLWVSFPRPGAAATDDITGSFCCHVHFLAGTEAAERWLAVHEGALALPLEEAFELGRLATRHCLGAR